MDKGVVINTSHKVTGSPSINSQCNTTRPSLGGLYYIMVKLLITITI